jgi:chorismate dehydratase
MSVEKIRISAVKYANTYPFMYGLSQTDFKKRAIISTDHPAKCAEKLINGSADIGLVPIASLPKIKDYRIITDYCLGAYGKVKTVLLLSNTPIEKVKKVSLDYRSMSSVNLVKILAKKWWNREFEWSNTSESFDFLNVKEGEAVVLIGDQCFEASSLFRYHSDLAEEWFRFTGLPFAFACWTSNKEIDPGFIDSFNKALAKGVNNIPDVVKKYGESGIIKGNDLFIYLTENMDFRLNTEKRKAIDLFLSFMAEL